MSDINVFIATKSLPEGANYPVSFEKVGGTLYEQGINFTFSHLREETGAHYVFAWASEITDGRNDLFAAERILEGHEFQYTSKFGLPIVRVRHNKEG